VEGTGAESREGGSRDRDEIRCSERDGAGEEDREDEGVLFRDEEAEGVGGYARNGAREVL